MPNPVPREKELPGHLYAKGQSAESSKKFFRKGPVEPVNKLKMSQCCASAAQEGQ